MSRRIAAVVIAGLGIALMAPPAPAAPRGRTSVEAPVSRAPLTDISAQRRVRRAPTRITVYPLSRWYRACVDWYALERRPSGTVVTPHMQCHWAVR